MTLFENITSKLKSAKTAFQNWVTSDRGTPGLAQQFAAQHAVDLAHEKVDEGINAVRKQIAEGIKQAGPSVASAAKSEPVRSLLGFLSGITNLFKGIVATIKDVINSLTSWINIGNSFEQLRQSISGNAPLPEEQPAPAAEENKDEGLFSSLGRGIRWISEKLGSHSNNDAQNEEHPATQQANAANPAGLHGRTPQAAQAGSSSAATEDAGIAPKR